MKDIDGDKNLHEIYHAWAQPMHGRFLKMNRESRFEGGHRPKIEIQGSSCRNICRRRDPKCYFDLIPKRKIKNQWKKLETKIPHGVFHWNTPWITGYFSFDFILLKIPIKLIMCFNYFSPLLGINTNMSGCHSRILDVTSSFWYKINPTNIQIVAAAPPVKGQTDSACS